MNVRTSFVRSDAELAAMAQEMLSHMEGIATLEQIKATCLAVQQHDGLEHQAKWLRDPVGIKEFVESPDYLNDQSVWPEVMKELIEINSTSKYTECVLTGAIGTAKTTIAVYTTIYQGIYLLSCMVDAHKELDQNPRHEIVSIIQSLNKETAKEVGYTRLREAVSESPYFKKNFMFDRRLESQMKFPRNIYLKPVSGNATAGIGQNVIGGIIDEINFMKVITNSVNSRDGKAYDQAKKNYNSIAIRRNSRFQKKGWTPGMLCLVSSRNYPGQFTDIKEAEAVSNKRIYVYDRRIWELRPERYNAERFRMFVGNDTNKPRILGDKEQVGADVKSLVMEIPTDLKEFFEPNKDVLEALRSIAGVAASSIHPFIPAKEKLAAAFSPKTLSVLSREDADFKTSKVAIYPKRMLHPSRTRWLHYDPALTNDHGGVAMGYVSHFVNQKRGVEYELLPNIVLDFILDIIPPTGGEIEFENVRRLIYALRDQKFPLTFISFDTMQSRDSLQILYQNKFKVGIRSMDKTTTAYDVTKQAIMDGRLQMPLHSVAQRELAQIEFNVKDKKIDHPPPPGSKDCADAIAGVVYGLTMQVEIWREHGHGSTRMPKPIQDILKAAANEKNSVDNRERRNRDAPPVSADFAVR